MVNGVAAFEVDTKSNSPDGVLTNHAQPEPNVVTAHLLNASLNASNEPHLALIASANAPVGAPPPLGFMLFQFPRLDPKMYPIADDQQFILELLLEEKVLLVQGSGFNWPTPDHFRVVFLPNVDDLREAIGRIGKFLEHYRKRHGG